MFRLSHYLKEIADPTPLGPVREPAGIRMGARAARGHYLQSLEIANDAISKASRCTRTESDVA